MKRLPFAPSALLLATLAASAAHAQQPVAIPMGGHAPAATSRTVIYTADCKQIHYQLRLDKTRRTLQFQYEDQHTVQQDLSGTPFGQALLKQPLIGNFGFSCAAAGLNVSFIGLQLQRGKQPQPVSYRLTIGNDGSILEDNGLTTEDLDFINTYLAG